MPLAEPKDAPVSHLLTRKHILLWKNTVKELKTDYPFIDRWPCMYCLNFVTYECLDGDDRSRFRCENAECVGKGKLQITCSWKIKSDQVELDQRLEKRLAQIDRLVRGGSA